MIRAAEVNPAGGYMRQFDVLPDPKRLMAHKPSLLHVLTALAANKCQRRPGMPTQAKKPSPYYDWIVDVMEELVKFTLLTRGVCGYLTDR